MCNKALEDSTFTIGKTTINILHLNHISNGDGEIKPENLWTDRRRGGGDYSNTSKQFHMGTTGIKTRLSNPVLNDSPLSEDNVESDCHACLPPIDSYGKSGQLPDSMAEEALPQPVPITTPIAVLNAEPVSGAEIETSAPQIADSLALTSPNYPIPVSIPPTEPGPSNILIPSKFFTRSSICHLQPIVISLASRMLVVIRRNSLIQGFLSCITMVSCVLCMLQTGGGDCYWSLRVWCLAGHVDTLMDLSNMKLNLFFVLRPLLFAGCKYAYRLQAGVVCDGHGISCVLGVAPRCVHSLGLGSRVLQFLKLLDLPFELHPDFGCSFCWNCAESGWKFLCIGWGGLSAITVPAWVVKLANFISNDVVWTVLPMVSSMLWSSKLLILLMALGSGSDATASGFCAEVDCGLDFLLWKYFVAVDADA
ncbi:hypothetical protein Nepgr_014706 [Nepenthes gracilis]|uniref:Uncharacterized protein n=1 Tax=Nepenthes gracilis TaxID=150966 RepID=A0AAD3SLC5_NEPGR|nr:hypothetical protein Nepgr_014706 [Nepenthes gracilis]